MPPNIAIIGAGPAGLTLARLLAVSELDVAVAIYERDASAKSRTFQGGTLDLHPDTGLAALRQAGLFDTAYEHLRYDGEELFIVDKNNTQLIHMKEQPKWADNKFARPEIDREVLKDILLASVDSSVIKWGKTLQSIDEGTGKLSFRDGSTAGPYDLVVGADGAWSKVRHVLTDVRPHYAGLCGFEGQIANPAKDHPHVSERVGRGSYFSFSNKKTRKPLPRTIAACGSDEDKLRHKILENYRDWAPELREYVEVSSNFRPWALYELPIGHSWEHKKGFTLVGDASSLMTPFAGEGVNKAMRDCLELVEALKDAAKNDELDLDAAVQKYETVMFPRAKHWQSETMQNKTLMFADDAPTEFLATMTVVAAREVGIDLTKGWKSLIPIQFSVRWVVKLVRLIGSWRRSVREWFR